MKTKLLLLVSVVLLLVLVVAGACVRRLLTTESTGIWTPAPVSGAPLVATRPAGILPTLAPVTLTRPAPPTLAPTASPTATSVPTPQPLPQPSPDPNLVIITEADVLRAVEAGVAGQGGASLEGVEVDFAEGKMILGVSRLTYGAIEVRNLLLVGRLVASEGQLRLDTESIAPRGLVTALIPTFANQALAQYTSQWYIEEVRTLDGRLELKVRLS